MDNQIRTVDQVSAAFLHAARKFLKAEYLPKIEQCLDQLSDEQIWWRANPASNSIGNLVLHLVGNARQWIVSGLGGERDGRMRQREFDERSIIPRGELSTILKKTLADVDDVLGKLAADEILNEHQIQGYNVSALQAVFHVTEHFSMHTGQIILLTKQLTGKDLDFDDL